MKRPNFTSPSHPVFAIAAGAVAGTAVIAGGMFISNTVADRNVTVSAERTTGTQSVSSDAASASNAAPVSESSITPAATESAATPTTSKEAPATKPATSKGTTTQDTPTVETTDKGATIVTSPAKAPTTKPQAPLVANVTKRNLSVFTTPQGLHCGMYGGSEGTSAFCRMDDRSVYPIPKDESSVCAGGDNPGELYVVTVDTKSGWGCTTEPDPEPVLAQKHTNGVFYKPAIDWYKTSPFPAAVKGTKAASGKAYVPVGGVIKNGVIQCKVLKSAVKCVNTSTKAGFVFTNSSVKFAKERTYPGEKG